MKALSLAAAAALAVLCPATASAQAAVKVVAEKPTFDDLLSPVLNIGKNKSGFTPRDWLEVETQIQVAMAPEPRNKTLDRLTVKWYVAVQNPEKKPRFLKFTREIEFVNVPVNEKVFCSVYLSPASIRRLTGSDRAGKRNVEAVGFEITVDGKEVASESSKGGKWWADPKFADSFADSDVVPLLRKSETPFAMAWWDRYAEELQDSSKR
jgi:hypothetical protein